MSRYPEHPQCAEDKYVEFDREVQLWCVFGTESGYCYRAYSGEVAATHSLGVAS